MFHLHFSFVLYFIWKQLKGISSAVTKGEKTEMFYIGGNTDIFNSIVHWLISNKLWINVSKTESMLIGSRQRIGHQHMAVNIAGIPLCHVTVVRYLGLYIDQHLTWQQRIDHVPKARAQLYNLQRLHLSAYLFGLMYQIFIIPLFDYCDVVWTPCLAKQLRAMEHIHSKITSTVQHLRDKLSSCFCYFLVEHRKFHTLIQIFRILHKMAPSCIFTRVTQVF